VEGVLVIDNLDIYLSAPGGNVPYIVTVRPFVTDGSITIDFATGSASNPQINGIEVYDGGLPIPSPTVAPVSSHPTVAPMALPPNSPPVTPSNGTFTDILINCGGTDNLACYVFKMRMLLISFYVSKQLLHFKTY
jgi:hypothetical protein